MSSRKPRLLWANVYCLLDSSSGASMCVREMLLQLQRSGWDINILGASVFDHERGTAGLLGHWDNLQQNKGKFVSIDDGPLRHHLLITTSTKRDHMTCREEAVWFNCYRQILEQYQPDVLFYYGGKPFDLLISNEAHSLEIPVAFFLVNGNYHKKRWHRDVDLVLTDSQATATMYKERLDLDVTPVGHFINPAKILPQECSRERILFINPSLEKGVIWVVRLAMWLEPRRPDIVFEVVESRGSWNDQLQRVKRALGQPRESLKNVIVTPNTNDMRPIYGRARLLLAPSLWWESGGRVSAEAMLNGIPAICTNRGGLPEMIQDGGILLELHERYYQKPYNAVPTDEEVAPLGEQLQSLYDDSARYEDLVQRARAVGQHQHSLGVSTQRLLNALQGLLGEDYDK